MVLSATRLGGGGNLSLSNGGLTSFFGDFSEVPIFWLFLAGGMSTWRLEESFLPNFFFCEEQKPVNSAFVKIFRTFKL